MELHRQKIQEAKGELHKNIQVCIFVSSAWIQNGLMTVVGVGVMAYLQVQWPFKIVSIQDTRSNFSCWHIGKLEPYFLELVKKSCCCRPWSRWGEPPSWEPALPLLCCVIPPLLLSQYTISKKPWTFTQISNFLPIWGDFLSKPSQGWAAVLDFTQSHSAFTLLPLNKFLAPPWPNVTSRKQSCTHVSSYISSAVWQTTNQSDSNISCRTNDTRMSTLIIYWRTQMSSLLTNRMACTYPGWSYFAATIPPSCLSTVSRS